MVSGDVKDAADVGQVDGAVDDVDDVDNVDVDNVDVDDVDDVDEVDDVEEELLRRVFRPSLFILVRSKIVFTCIPTLYHTSSNLRPDFSFETLISTFPTFLRRPFSSLVHENSILCYIFRVSLKNRGMIPSFQETSSDLEFWSE